MAHKNKIEGRWYVKKGDKIAGPFPNQLISRYLILGRLDLENEISQDQKNWSAVKEFKALVPEVVLNANTKEGAKALMLARIREDERSARPLDEAINDERRVDEDQILKLHRQLRDDIIKSYRNQPRLNTRLLSGVLLVVIITVLAFVFYRPSDNEQLTDCTSLARPGVNWTSCNKQGQSLAGMDLSDSIFKSTRLSGADLSRSRLDGSDLSYANLSQAKMPQSTLRNSKLRGANLRQANLQGADLQYADLSYAELEGARLEGAVLDNTRFDHAIWINGEKCLSGSVGACLLAK